MLDQTKEESMLLANHKRLSKRSGQVFILLILFLTVVTTTISFGLAAINRTNTQTLTNQVQTTRAIYIAQAGLEDAIYQLRLNSTWRTGFTNKVFPAGSTSSYNVTVAGAPPDLTLTCVGATPDVTKTIMVSVSVLPSPLSVATRTAPFVIATNTWDEN